MIPIENGLDFFVCLFLEEWPLTLQTTLMTQELFLVEIGNLPLLCAVDFHEAGTITPNSVNLQVSF